MHLTLPYGSDRIPARPGAARVQGRRFLCCLVSGNAGPAPPAPGRAGRCDIGGEARERQRRPPGAEASFRLRPLRRPGRPVLLLSPPRACRPEERRDDRLARTLLRPGWPRPSRFSGAAYRTC